MEVHGLGTKGDFSEKRWTTKYTVYTSEDGVTYSPLLNTHTGQPRVCYLFPIGCFMMTVYRRQHSNKSVKTKISVAHLIINE